MLCFLWRKNVFHLLACKVLQFSPSDIAVTFGFIDKYIEHFYIIAFLHSDWLINESERRKQISVELKNLPVVIFTN